MEITGEKHWGFISCLCFCSWFFLFVCLFCCCCFPFRVRGLFSCFGCFCCCLLVGFLLLLGFCFLFLFCFFFWQSLQKKNVVHTEKICRKSSSPQQKILPRSDFPSIQAALAVGAHNHTKILLRKKRWRVNGY